MGRVAKKAPETPKVIDDTPAQTITQTRAKRTPKPNPKYANDSIVIPPKIESSESNGSTDIEDKLPETKIVKSTKKVISKNEDSVAKVKGAAVKKQAITVKKQKIDFEDDEKTKDADEVPLSPVRTTRSIKTDVKDEKGEIKVGEESVAIIDVSSIIGKNPVKQESPKNTRGPGRKRQAAEAVEIKEESPKKKKEEEKPSLITARKSYMPAVRKTEEEPKIDDVSNENEITPKDEKDAEVKTPASTIKTRRNAITPQSAETLEKKTKIDIVKPEITIKSTVEAKKLPTMKKEQITKVAPVTASLPTKGDNVATALSPKPAPRILNSMISPKGAKLSPNVKLAGDGSDKKVFSIQMSDGSLVEKKPTITSPVKPPSSAVKENVAIVTKPQPSVLLKNKLESELNRMKASANLMKRQMLTAPQARVQAQPNATSGARRITKFESWYVIDVKNQEATVPYKHHTHNHSLIRLGNKIKELQLPSTNWDFKITLQRRQQRKQNNNDDEEEIYTGDVHDKAIEADKHNFEPSSILFKRSHRDSNKIIIDRSLMLKQNMYTITINGKQCHLVGAPDDIKSMEDLEILLKIIDTSTANHSCIETAC